MFNKDELPVMGILRGISEKDVSPLIDVFVKTGIRYVEITMNTPGASDLISKMINEAGAKLVVGAGTVLSMDDMDKALNAGANFIVSPSVKEELIKHCAGQGIPVFPGALTPTEVHRAWDSGATMVKLFPAGLYGPGYIKALKGPFDEVKIIAVGGINEQNVSKYLSNGSDAVAIGAGIIKPGWLAEEGYDFIEEKIKRLLANCRPD